LQEELEVSVEDLLAQLKRKGIPLPSEIGAFIALEACEQIEGSPVRLSGRDIILGAVGEIMVEAPEAACPEPEAAKALLHVLGELLVCAAPGVSPMLLELVEQGPSDGAWTLGRLRGDLEACLLPLNRGATRRVLARLLREVGREGERASLRPSDAPDANTLDTELDALLGDDGSPVSQTVARGALSANLDPPLTAAELDPDEGIDVDTVDLPDEPAAAPAPPPKAAPRVRAEPDDVSTVEPKKPIVAKAKAPKLDVDEDLFAGEPKPHGGGAVLGGMFVLIAVILAVAYATLGQMGARKLFGLETVDQERSAPPPPPAVPQVVIGELRVTSVPAKAQVLLLVGSGPALATSLPVGVAHEFVALAEGRAPSRALVAPDAAWEPTPEGPRYELAMQTGKEAAAVAALDLGPTLLTSAIGAPTGQLGTVRVITTPPGAKVYQLVGFTPEVRVQNLVLDRGYDVLVYAPGYEAEQRHLESGDFRADGPERVATLQITLRKQGKR
jgi:hypothetical protein